MITSVYIHIPFCDHLCNYCDFCKRYTNYKMIKDYLDALEEEIKEKYQDEEIKTLYIGGGTPSSLSLANLKRLMHIIKKFKLAKDYEFTIEVNPENVTKEKLELFKKFSINRISIGVESTNIKFLKYLGRKHDFKLVCEKVQLMKKLGFNNINVDLIYALPNETLHDLKKDLDNILSLDINHISTYSLEIHQNTILDIKKEKNVSEDLDNKMYYYICSYLEQNNFNHYEISNFCKNNSYSRHNLVYWHNERYYGFGMGASGYIGNIRYTNTRSLINYINKKRIIEKEKLSLNDQKIYELILGFRLIKGINKNSWKEKYHEDILKQKNISKLIDEGYLVDDGENIYMSYNMLYIENCILENFVE